MARISYLAGESVFARPLPAWKRAIDVAASFFGVIVLSPLFLIIAAYIKIVSPGPIFFKQKRAGYGGKEFTIWKFRTMKFGADSTIHANHVTALMRSEEQLTKLDAYTDPRILPLGKIIRQTGLDELPQLFNVLRGEMSLIGPRPDPVYATHQYGRWQRARLDVVPGITGLWQVSGKNRTTFNQMIRLDITYARKQSFGLDARILTRTPSAVLQQVKDGFVRHKSDPSLPGSRPCAQPIPGEPQVPFLPDTFPSFRTLTERASADSPQQTYASNLRSDVSLNAADRRDPLPPRNRAMLRHGENP